MQIVMGDIWDLYDQIDKSYIVIPTNMYVNAKGFAVMGRGLAKQCVNKFPMISKVYGHALQNNITIKGVFINTLRKLILLPVKYKYDQKADLDLIEKSLKILKSLNTSIQNYNIFMPMLGCGFGGLNYEDILPLILNSEIKNVTIVIPSNSIYGKEEYRDSFLPSKTGLKDRGIERTDTFDDICY